MIAGTGRHADSMGNRETFESPGLQWISVGSGIEHAEAGGTKAGQDQEGFQIWLNVPAKHKRDDPMYGTDGPEKLPVIQYEGVSAIVLAGTVKRDEEKDVVGPFRTKQAIQMVDFNMKAGAKLVHSVPGELDTCMVYISSGSGTVSGKNISKNNVVLFDATDANKNREFELIAGQSGMRAILFAGKKIKGMN
jgi:hypothetical protein